MGSDYNAESFILYYQLINILRFLLVSLTIEVILQESTTYRRRERLRNMIDGSGLEGAYGATIERIKAQGGDKSRLGMGALMWISYAERLLSPEELCYALAIELGSTDFNSGNIPSILTLVGCCQGLITMDKKTSSVRLIHFTLREYLSLHPDIFSRPHSLMAEICLTYLNSQQVKAHSTDPSVDPHKFFNDKPFLGYSSVYWGVHARRELSECAISLALELLRKYDGHISVVHLLQEEFDCSDWQNEDWDWQKEMYRSGLDRGVIFNGLHCASFLGICEIVAALIEIGCCDLNGRGFYGYTPLAWAAEKGNEDTVKLLLGREGIKPEKPDILNRTPLFQAAYYGHAGVVKMILGREEVNPDRPGQHARTPLFVAAKNGHKEVVKMLLEVEEVTPDKPDHDHRTPLFVAAENGHEEVVKMLLWRDEVNPEKPDYYDQTPLLVAAKSGYAEVVKMLVGREEVNLEKPDYYDQTPLLVAAEGGHEEVVKILLGREEVNPDKPDDDGRTPLSLAANAGKEGVVKILLEREDVNPDKPDNTGRTPLSHAVGKGHEEVVNILLRREGVNPDRPDSAGRTPLMWAPGWCHQRMTALLQVRRAITHSAI